jgi:ABC-type multidrug transport system fused ATPase/permease subunit
MLRQLLERRDKMRLGVSLLLVLTSTGLEMLGIGLVVPVLQVLLLDDPLVAMPWLPVSFGGVSREQLVVIAMTLLSGVYIAKNLFGFAATYVQLRIQLSISNRLVQRLFETYIRQPYEFHLQHSSALLVRNVQEYSTAVITYGINPTISLVSDLTLGVGVLALLLVAEPLGTVILLIVFGVAAAILILFFRRKSRIWGSERTRHRGILMESLLNGFGAVKELKITGRDNQLLRIHEASLGASARSSYLFGTLQSLPKALFEVLAVAGVTSLVFIALWRGDSLPATVSTIALFAVGAFRMLPSVNRIIQSAQQFSFGRSAIEGAADAFKLSPDVNNQRQQRRDSFKILQASGLTFSYPGSHEVVTNIPHFVLSSGESVGVIGTSGSGKSTFVDLILGILEPTSGEILVNGRLVSSDRRYWQDRVGYVPQNVFLIDGSIRSNVAFGVPSGEVNDQRVIEALEVASLWDFVQGLPGGMDTVVGERGTRLSGGQRQRLGLARAVYDDPQVLVLDEATSALDSETEKSIVQSLREMSQNITLIMIAHRVSTLEGCSRIVRIEDGKIVQDGTYEEVVGSLSAS